MYEKITSKTNKINAESKVIKTSFSFGASKVELNCSGTLTNIWTFFLRRKSSETICQLSQLAKILHR